MTKFITTIQLQEADERDYVTLFEELKKHSFQNEKHGAKSKAWVGGKAVFSREGDLSIFDVNNLIFRTASRIGKKFSFSVVRNKTGF